MPGTSGSPAPLSYPVCADKSDPHTDLRLSSLLSQAKATTLSPARLPPEPKCEAPGEARYNLMPTRGTHGRPRKVTRSGRCQGASHCSTAPRRPLPAYDHHPARCWGRHGRSGPGRTAALAEGASKAERVAGQAKAGCLGGRDVAPLADNLRGGAKAQEGRSPRGEAPGLPLGTWERGKVDGSREDQTHLS